MIKVLVTGSNGQLGKSIQTRVQSAVTDIEFLFTDVEELDICDTASVEKMISEFKPVFVLNCAAYTAVDKAEEEENSARRINAEGPANLARSSEKHGARLIHTSTDYVFSGKGFRPYTEEDTPDPHGAYGRTKLQGEQAVLHEQEDAIIIRTAWLYSEYGHNFVKTMLRLGQERDEINVVADQIGNPTWAGDLADFILYLLKHDAQAYSGIFHYSNEGIASWYDLALATMEMADLSCKVNAIRTEDYPLPAPRPFYSAMEKHLVRSTFGIKIPHWRDSLKKCIRNIRKESV